MTKLHPKYKKVVRRTRKFHAHDEQNAAGVGDTVRIVESRRISKTRSPSPFAIFHKVKICQKDGGRERIRTSGRLTPTPDFESGAFNHSATLPHGARCRV